MNKTTPVRAMRIGCVAVLAMFAGRPLLAQPWTATGPARKSIRALAQSPTDAGTLYAGSFGWGIFKSTDAGAGWSNQKKGMTNTYVRSVLAPSGGTVYAGTNDGVFKSTDAGASWQLSLATLNSVRSLAYDGANNALYAATFGTGLYKSTNQGSSWFSLTVTDPVSGQTLQHLWSAVLFSGNSLYAGGSILDIASGGALFKSVDGGASWVQVQRGTGIRSSVHSIALNPADPLNGLIIGTATRGVYRSTNAGVNWSDIDGATLANPLADPNINSVAHTSSQWCAGTDSTGKFYYRATADVSVGWLAGTGLPGAPKSVEAVRVDAVNGAILYAGTEGEGLYRSTNGGAAWQPRNAGMLGTAGRTIGRIADGSLLLGTDFGDGIWRSTDSGGAWIPAESLTTSNSITSFGITNSAALVYAGAYGSGVYKSTDGGRRWTITDSTVVSHFVRTLAVPPADPSTVYAGTGSGVYKTSNSGAAWFPVNNGIPASTSIRSMALDRSNPSVVYAGSDSSFLYKTTNGGGSWTHITSSAGFLARDMFIRCITIDPGSSATLYTGADSGRVYRSTDAGAGWSLLGQVPSAFSVRSVMVHPALRTTLFAATFGAGVFVSIDSGSHWSAFNAGLSDLELYTLESDNGAPLTLFGGTGTHGVVRTSYTFVDRRPRFAPAGGKSVIAGQLLSFSVSASDSDLTIPLLSVLDPPAGASFSDHADGTGTFTWTPAGADTGVRTVSFEASDGRLADTLAVSVTVLPPGQSIVVHLAPEAGWNMVSVPVLIADARVASVFPSASTRAFGYNGAYAAHDSLDRGLGYWLKFPAPKEVQIGGTRIPADSVPVNARWNIIGSISYAIPAAQVSAVPPVTIASPFFGFASGSGYSQADTIFPGRAYWVKVSLPGVLVLDSASTPLPAAAGRPRTVSPEPRESIRLRGKPNR